MDDHEQRLWLKLLSTERDGNIQEVVETLSLQDKKLALIIAARYGLYEVVIYLLEHGVPDVHYIDGCSNNMLHLLLYSCISVKQDKSNLILQWVVKLVDAGVDVNQVNDDKKTPIFIAAEQGLYEFVIYLLEHGVDVNHIDGCSNNMLHLLIDSYSVCVKPDKRDLILQCIYKLVNAGVDVNQVNDDKETPLFIAARRRVYEVVIYLLEHGVADVHYIDGRSNNLLHLLLDKYVEPDRHDLILQWVVRLVDAGVDVNQVNEDKKTPIFIAARYRLYEVVIYLLEHGVDVNHIDKFKRNILHYVLGDCFKRNILSLSSSNNVLCAELEEKWIQMVDTLIKTGVNINQPDHIGNTPLFSFVEIYENYLDIIPISFLDKYVPLHVKLIYILLKAGCNVNHQNKLGQSALMYHLKFQADISILKLLIHHSDLSLIDNNGDTAISYCVQYYMLNSIGVFKLLIDSGSDLMSGNNGIRLFHDILKCKRFWVFSYYIGRKLIVNGFTAEGENMLHLLAGVNYDYSLNKFQWLLNSKLDINHPCSKTNTSTMVAAFLLNSKYLELFTRHHPRLEINKRNKQGHTALHLCIIGFTMFKDGLNKRQVNEVVKNYCRQIYPIYMACIDILLGVDRIDVNIPDNRGRTSLMMAAMKNDRVLTRKLLQAGAKVTMLDYLGRSALQYVNIYQSVFDLTCFKLLLSNGNTGLLNLPCIDGNTIIQTALCFPCLWEPCQAICFIRYLVAENCCLQILASSSLESYYNQIDLTELNHQERDKLRKLLHLSGTEGEEIMTCLDFVEEDKRYERTDIIHSQGRAEFVGFCSNISLKSLCRRFIRQKLGYGITDKVKDLELPRELNDFLLLKDILHPEDYNIEYIDDGCDDDDADYDGYDLDDRDDDYSEYKYYQYFTLNTDHELRQDCKENKMYPNGRVVKDDCIYGAAGDDEEKT